VGHPLALNQGTTSSRAILYNLRAGSWGPELLDRSRAWAGAAHTDEAAGQQEPGP